LIEKSRKKTLWGLPLQTYCEIMRADGEKNIEAKISLDNAVGGRGTFEEGKARGNRARTAPHAIGGTTGGLEKSFTPKKLKNLKLIERKQNKKNNGE